MSKPEYTEPGSQPDTNLVVPPSVAIPQDQSPVEDEDGEPNGPITVTKTNA